jgi:hypothetical protein
MNYSLKREDLKFGFQSEDDLLDDLERHFGCELRKTTQYHPFDFESTEKRILIELKSRRIKHDQFPDLMIGGNKIKYGNTMIKNKDYKIYYIFKCLDGVYGYEYLKDTKLRSDINGNKRRNDKCYLVNYIPCSELKMIKKHI